MYQSMSYFELSMLVGMGFKFGITDEVLWGTDNNGDEWQVLADNGMFLTFAKYDKQTKLTDSHRRMSHTEFRSLFCA